MIVLGMDPSMSNWGFAKSKLDLDKMTFSTPELVLTQTESGKDKRVRKNSDDLERASLISEELKRQLEGVDMVFIEVPHGSQSARAMASYGICIGIISTIKVPIIQLTEQQVKLASVGIKTATKAEMIEWATTQYPNANWLTRAGKRTAKNEHLADATAALHAGIKTIEFQSIVTALKSLRAA